MPSEKNKILEFNQHVKSDNVPYINYADNDVLTIQRIIQRQIFWHLPCGYSVPTIWFFHHIENEHIVYCRMNCLKKFCESLREHAKNMIDFENKKVLPLTKKN